MPDCTALFCTLMLPALDAKGKKSSNVVYLNLKLTDGTAFSIRWKSYQTGWGIKVFRTVRSSAAETSREGTEWQPCVLTTPQNIRTSYGETVATAGRHQRFWLFGDGMKRFATARGRAGRGGSSTVSSGDDDHHDANHDDEDGEGQAGGSGGYDDAANRHDSDGSDSDDNEDDDDRAEDHLFRAHDDMQVGGTERTGEDTFASERHRAMHDSLYSRRMRMRREKMAEDNGVRAERAAAQDTAAAAAERDDGRRGQKRSKWWSRSSEPRAGAVETREGGSGGDGGGGSASDDAAIGRPTGFRLFGDRDDRASEAAALGTRVRIWLAIGNGELMIGRGSKLATRVLGVVPYGTNPAAGT